MTKFIKSFSDEIMFELRMSLEPIDYDWMFETPALGFISVDERFATLISEYDKPRTLFVDGQYYVTFFEDNGYVIAKTYDNYYHHTLIMVDTFNEIVRNPFEMDYFFSDTILFYNDKRYRNLDVNHWSVRGSKDFTFVYPDYDCDFSLASECIKNDSGEPFQYFMAGYRDNGFYDAWRRLNKDKEDNDKEERVFSHTKKALEAANKRLPVKLMMNKENTIYVEGEF